MRSTKRGKQMPRNLRMMKSSDAMNNESEYSADSDWCTPVLTEMEVETMKQVAVMQHQIADLTAKVDKLSQDVATLVELRTKGMGAFWLGSSLFGVGVYLFLSWFKG